MRDLGATELLEAAARGDQQAWNELVDRYGRLVYAVARSFRLRPEDVDDVFQTVWFRLAEHIDRVREPERVGSWLGTTTRNECLRLLGTHTRVLVTDDLDTQVDDRTPIDDEIARAEQRAAVREAFALLPERCRRLLAMIIDPDHDYRSIGHHLHMPQGSIGPTRARCLRLLDREYQRVYGEPSATRPARE